MRLAVTAGGVDLTFTEPQASGAYPWLVKVGPLLLAARAGHLSGVGIGESANMTVELDNTSRQAATLLGFCPRAPAVVYDDAGDEFFSGLVQRLDFGALLALTLEA